MNKDHSISNYTLPERLKYIRSSRGLTQAQLAKKAGLGQSTIGQIESGAKDPSISTLRKIAAALDIEMAVLFASDDVHVFDMKRLNKKYKKVEQLNPTLHVAIDRVIRYAKKIGFLD